MKKKHTKYLLFRRELVRKLFTAEYKDTSIRFYASIDELIEANPKAELCVSSTQTGLMYEPVEFEETE